MTVIAELVEMNFVCRTESLDSGHVFIGDEPEKFHGQNKGLNPFALLQSSLANWTVVTLVGVSREKNMALAGVKVRVAHQQNILDCYGPFDPRQRSLKITKLRRHIEVSGELSQEDVETLLWGANHCPVSNTLKGAIEIETKIKLV